MTLTPDTDSVLPSSPAARRTSRNAMALMLSAVVTKGLLFLWQIYLARKLGVELYGVYGTISALVIIAAAIPDFGLGLIVIRDVAARPQDSGRYLAATLAVQPILATIGYGVLMIVAAVLGLDGELWRLVGLAGLSLLIDAIGNMGHNQLIAFEHMGLTSVVSVGHTIALLVLGSVTLALSPGLWSLYFAIIMAGLLRMVAYWVILLRIGIRPVFPVTGKLMRYLLINGAPFALNAFVSLAYINSDKLLSTLLIGPEATGQLMASFVIVSGATELLSTPMLVAVFPLMSRLHNDGRTSMFNRMLEKLSFLSLLASLPLALCISLLAVPLAGLLFGNSFAGAAEVLRIMIWYVLVKMIVSVFTQALVVQNRQRWLLVVRITGLMLSVMLNIFLLPRLGISGTAVAMIASEVLVLTLILRSLDLPRIWWQRMVAYILRLAIVGILVMAIILPLMVIHPVVVVVVGVPVYAGLLFLVGVVKEDDWALLNQLIAEVPGGMWILQVWKR